MTVPGRLSRKAITTSLILAPLLLICAGLAAILLRPMVLNHLHRAEMGAAIKHFYETLASIEGQSDYQVMAEIATGDYLAYLAHVQCGDCPGVQVARLVNVVDLQVLDYSPHTARVYARIEYGWNIVSPATGKVSGQCHAQAFSGIYLLVRQDDLWKVAGGEDVNANRVDDTPQLLDQYCSDD